jgi:hypothetical protein
MSPALQLIRNISAALTALGVSGASAHDSGDTTSLPKVVAILDNSTRIEGLPGLYDVTGQIEMQISPDDYGLSERQELQADLWATVADIERFSAAIGTNLNLYIWKIESESISEDDPLFTYSIQFSARISLTPPL